MATECRCHKFQIKEKKGKKENLIRASSVQQFFGQNKNTFKNLAIHWSVCHIKIVSNTYTKIRFIKKWIACTGCTFKT